MRGRRKLAAGWIGYPVDPDALGLGRQVMMRARRFQRVQQGGQRQAGSV